MSDFLKDLGLGGDGDEPSSALLSEMTFDLPDGATHEQKAAAAVRWSLRDLAAKITAGELVVEGVPAEARHFGISLQLTVVGFGVVDLDFRFTRTGAGVVPWREDEQVAELARQVAARIEGGR